MGATKQGQPARSPSPGTGRIELRWRWVRGGRYPTDVSYTPKVSTGRSPHGTTHNRPLCTSRVAEFGVLSWLCQGLCVNSLRPLARPTRPESPSKAIPTEISLHNAEARWTKECQCDHQAPERLGRGPWPLGQETAGAAQLVRNRSVDRSGRAKCSQWLAAASGVVTLPRSSSNAIPMETPSQSAWAVEQGRSARSTSKGLGKSRSAGAGPEGGPRPRAPARCLASTIT